MNLKSKPHHELPTMSSDKAPSPVDHVLLEYMWFYSLVARN